MHVELGLRVEDSLLLQFLVFIDEVDPLGYLLPQILHPVFVVQLVRHIHRVQFRLLLLEGHALRRHQALCIGHQSWRKLPLTELRHDAVVMK